MSKIVATTTGYAALHTRQTGAEHNIGLNIFMYADGTGAVNVFRPGQSEAIGRVELPAETAAQLRAALAAQAVRA